MGPNIYIIYIFFVVWLFVRFYSKSTPLRGRERPRRRRSWTTCCSAATRRRMRGQFASSGPVLLSFSFAEIGRIAPALIEAFDWRDECYLFTFAAFHTCITFSILHVFLLFHKIRMLDSTISMLDSRASSTRLDAKMLERSNFSHVFFLPSIWWMVEALIDTDVN